jgi:hypothetical protein
MYQVTFFSKPTENGGYECASANMHTFYLIALTDAVIEWFMNRKVKCVEIVDRNTDKIKLSWKRN